MPDKNQSTHYQSTVLEVRKLYSDGLSFNKVALKLNLSYDTVKRWIENPEFCGSLTDKEKLDLWLENKIELKSIRSYISDYIWHEAGNKCSKCGWCEIHPITGNIPLEIDHIDGNRSNNNYINLRLLCPNCHGATPTFQTLNVEYNNKNRVEILKNIQCGIELFNNGLSCQQAAKKINIHQYTLYKHLIIKNLIDRDRFNQTVQDWFLKINKRKYNKIPTLIRIYLMEKHNNSCGHCSSSVKNIYSDDYILQIDHIDGDNQNHIESNLRVLCYNCHSLTNTYKTLNQKYLDYNKKKKEEKSKKLLNSNKKCKIFLNYSSLEIFDLLEQNEMSIDKTANAMGCHPNWVRHKINQTEETANKYKEYQNENREKPLLRETYSSQDLLEILKEPGMNYIKLEERIKYSRAAIMFQLRKDNLFEKSSEILRNNKISCKKIIPYSSQEIMDIIKNEGITLHQLGKRIGWSFRILNRKIKRSGFSVNE